MSNDGSFINLAADCGSGPVNAAASATALMLCAAPAALANSVTFTLAPLANQ